VATRRGCYVFCREHAEELQLAHGFVSPRAIVTQVEVLNSLGYHERAISIALQTIENLQDDIANDTDNELLVVWTMAWNNLGVAQLASIQNGCELADSVESRFSALQQAVQKCQTHFGPSHQLTKVVFDTFRSVRDELRRAPGGFKQHRAGLPAIQPRPPKLNSVTKAAGHFRAGMLKKSSPTIDDSCLPPAEGATPPAADERSKNISPTDSARRPSPPNVLENRGKIPSPPMAGEASRTVISGVRASVAAPRLCRGRAEARRISNDLC